MNLAEFQTVKFSEIRDRLPPDCMARWLSKFQGERPENVTVLYHEGDARLPSLDLDDPLGLAGEAKDDGEPIRNPVYYIFVTGNLTVESFICNLDTDGATGLIVAGNLSARNILAGGQEIYVGGDLQVAELFWGDYNHGSLTVRGDVTAQLLIETEGYHVEIDGKQVMRRLNNAYMDDRWCIADAKNGPIEPECLFEDQDIDGPLLWRERMLELLREGRPILRRDKLEHKVGPEIPSIFPDRSISLENIKLATTPDLLGPGDASREGAAPLYQFQTGDLFCRAVAYRDERAGEELRGFYLEGEGRAVYLRAAAVSPGRGLFGWFKKRPEPQWSLSYEARHLKGEDTEWQALDAPLPGPFQGLLRDGWEALLNGVSCYHYARNLIPIERLRTLLALPIAAPYDDFYSNDRNGLWLDDVYCSFRQEGALFEGEPKSALLRVGFPSPEAEISGDTAFFFMAHRHLDGSECVLIDYKPDFEGDERLCLNYIGGPKLDTAMRVFERAWTRMMDANEELLAGTPPNEDDAFALNHWKMQGFIK